MSRIDCPCCQRDARGRREMIRRAVTFGILGTVAFLGTIGGLIMMLPDNPGAGGSGQSRPSVGVSDHRAPMIMPSLALHPADPYDRCLMAVDGAHLASELCDPLAHPRHVMPGRRVLQEDDRGWTCRTMGDRVCSPDRVAYGNGARFI